MKILNENINKNILNRLSEWSNEKEKVQEQKFWNEFFSDSCWNMYLNDLTECANKVDEIYKSIKVKSKDSNVLDFVDIKYKLYDLANARAKIRSTIDSINQSIDYYRR